MRKKGKGSYPRVDPIIGINTKGHHLRPAHIKTYSSWWSMIDRCYRPANPMFYMYGGAGIRVCKRWHDFANFLADMGERPEGMTLDRFPNRKIGYRPSNVRWASTKQQGVNRKTTRLTESLVQEIHGRHEHGESNASIARRMNVSRCHVSLILSGDKWQGSKDGPRDSG